MNTNTGIALLVMAAAICVVTALAHMSCIALGSACYEYQLAPAALIESSKNGTLLAPLATIAITGVFALWAAYALSAAKVIRRLPLLSLGIYVIAFLSIVRGILGIQLWIRKPERLTEFGVVSSWVWFVMGLLFLIGFLLTKRPKVKKAEPEHT